ncbi:hypothetical protein [Legionella parisiensis]|uniref:Uncharacterized protein n=1 Tax=Legionella parisiensis TaxID=45071 RepID=A0A1E5JTW0_9GAMM|nr:hypothetical protein [Legionella parisiensis]KTD43088.1 coiled-coil protein [Legionella parisiensis]OEH47967.1 hypothetical protein lpari_00991 [Legionella parisiensis]STX77833.1 coiled-coil protein [Legionella parisiensis]
MQVKSEVINGLAATVTRTSKYPIPWTGKKEERPKDYFEQMQTSIKYKENKQNVEIIIPSVQTEQENRTRKLRVRVNGKEYPFNKAAIATLDMSLTFDLPEMEKLLALVNNSVSLNVDYSVLRASLPFFYIQDAEYQVPEDKAKVIGTHDGQLLKTHGDIEQLALPYINAMKYHPNIRRELYFPVATLGDPHHWNVGILTIDEHDNPTLTYLESSAPPVDETYLNYYKHDVLPGINKALRRNGYKTIDEQDIILDASKQFSLRGCGIAAALNIQNLLNGILKLNEKDQPPSTDKRISIEEDAVRRVQLAMRLTKHDDYLAQWRDAFPEYHQQVSEETHYKHEGVLRELTTHPRFLKQKAKEVFPDIDPHERLKIDLELYERKFDTLLEQLKEQLKDIRDELSEKNTKTKGKYEAVASDVNTLFETLEREMGEFFANPSASKYLDCHKKCTKVIENAEHESANHRGWHKVNPILRGFAGVLVGLSGIGILIVANKSKNGYFQTFFAKPPTETFKKIQAFKMQFEADKKAFEEDEKELSEEAKKLDR